MGAWVTLEHDAVQRGFEVDRHMRNWLLWALIALVVWELAQFNGFETRRHVDAREHGLVVLARTQMAASVSIGREQAASYWMGNCVHLHLEIGPSLLLFEYVGEPMEQALKNRYGEEAQTVLISQPKPTTEKFRTSTWPTVRN